MWTPETTSIAHYIPAGFLLLLAGYVAAVNWGCAIVSQINRRKGIDRHHSFVPLISVFLSGFAYFVCPRSGRNWVFVVPLCDIGNWVVLWLPFWLLKEAWQKNPGGPFSNDSGESARQVEQDKMADGAEPPHSREKP